MKQLVRSAPVVAVLSLAACGSDGSESVDRPPVESIVDDSTTRAVTTEAPPATLLPTAATTLQTATAIEPSPLLANEPESAHPSIVRYGGVDRHGGARGWW